MVDVRRARKAALRYKALKGMKRDVEKSHKQVNKYKGKYAGPDKYKGVIPPHLKHKYKGKYFGKESNKGGNVSEDLVSHPDMPPKKKLPVRSVKPGLPPGYLGFPGGPRKGPSLPVQSPGRVQPKVPGRMYIPEYGDGQFPVRKPGVISKKPPLSGVGTLPTRTPTKTRKIPIKKPLTQRPMVPGQMYTQ